MKRRQDESQKASLVRAEEERIEASLFLLFFFIPSFVGKYVSKAVKNEEKIVPLCIDNKPQMVARARDEGGETSREDWAGTGSQQPSCKNKDG